jgi:hypothetical protein
MYNKIKYKISQIKVNRYSLYWLLIILAFLIGLITGRRSNNNLPTLANCPEAIEKTYSDKDYHDCVVDNVRKDLKDGVVIDDLELRCNSNIPDVEVISIDDISKEYGEIK